MSKPVIRCSQLAQLLSCGASRTLIPLVNPRTGGEGYEGTLIHWYVAKRLVHELGASEPAGGLPLNVPNGYMEPKTSKWIQSYCFSTVKHSLAADWSLEVETPIAYEIPLLRPYYAVNPDGEACFVESWILSGHIDALALNSDATEGCAWDWKTGYNAVEPAECNSQALGYIVLAKKAYPSLKKFTFFVVQPRNNPEEGDERVTEVAVEGDALEKCVAFLESEVNAALERADELNSGRKQCNWCPVGIQCPAIQQEIRDMKMKLTPEMIARITREPNDALLGDIIIATLTFGKALEDAKELLYARLDANAEVVAGSGVRITQKKEGGKYTVTDPVAMFGTLRELIPAEKLAPALSYPVTRIKDALAEAMDIPKGGKAAITAESVFDAKLGPFVEQGTKRKLLFG